MRNPITHFLEPRCRRQPMSRGFALIVTLSMMVLLSILAVGLLSLSSVALRTSSRNTAQAEARANARVSLILAIGELQKHAGLDTRVTAPSGIVDKNSTPLTGVWKSWEGDDHELTGPYAGRPEAPPYDLKRESLNNGGRFLTWLVSTAAYGSAPKDPASLASKTQQGDNIAMLSAGTLGDSVDGSVFITPKLLNQSGYYAWWVSGENQKVRLPQPHKPVSESVARWSEIAKSHAVPDPEPFGLNALVADPADFTPDPANPKPVAKAISRSTADFLITDDTKPKPRQFFHDLSTSSVGLLTNTATGGWRKDLSILTENWDSIFSKLGSTGTLPLFRYSPFAGDVSQIPFPTTTTPKPAKSIFYPWDAYLGAGGPAHDQNGCVNSWRHLVDYATFYRNPLYNAGANGTNTIALNWANLPHIKATDLTNVHNYLHRVRPMPVIARFHWLYSLKTVLTNPAELDKSKWIYNLQLLVTPVFTLWNPYNVSISVPNFAMFLKKSPPCLIQFYKADGTALPYKRLIKGVAVGGGYDTATTPAVFPTQESLRYNINSAFTLAPGQTRVFSASSQVTGATAATMTPGLNLNGGHLATINDSASISTTGVALVYAATDVIKVNLQFTYEMNHAATEKGKGIYLEVFGNTNRLQMFYFMTFKMTDEETNLYWPPILATDLAQATAEQLDKPPDADGVKKATPLFSTVFGSRVVSDTNLPGKGLMQSNPLTSYSNGVQAVVAFPGSTHPVNSALDYSFIAHTQAGDSRLPNAGDAAANHNGFIITGFDAGTGLTRVMINDLPLRPISSLGQLQHWDMRSQNPRPPFALNIIGNSDATPLIQNNLVFRSPAPNHDEIYDDSYCANHLLFDDWFASSIAPNPTNFGTVGEDIRTHYLKFLKGQTLLANRDYRPIAADRMLSDTDANTRADDILTTAKDAWGWRRVASRIEVEGMFNVNSTSVTAWRALLGHCRDQKIPHFAQAGMTTSAATDYAVTRFPVSADAKAGGAGISGNTEFTGYRVFTDPMLDSLAEKIVAQIRLRGPFLSLSEFVNRQLRGDNNDLAVAGAIQTALNQLSDGSANDPMKSLKALQVVKNTNPDPVGDEKYLFRKAAEGLSAYGMPGWIRQADILTPLAPILSARDDTFTIRAYGDSRDSTGAVIAKAWCEATVRRTRDFVDPADPADNIDTPVSAVNTTFGRRFEIVAFRWLSPDEV